MRALLARLRRLALVEDGVAAVEFALILPIMLLVYIGSVEASLAITMDRKVQSVAGALGDLVARSDTTIPADTLEDYFKAAGGIMTPYPTDELKQVVTQVLVSDDGTSATVVWSREYVDGDVAVGTDHAVGDSYTLPQAMRTIAQELARAPARQHLSDQRCKPSGHGPSPDLRNAANLARHG